MRGFVRLVATPVRDDVTTFFVHKKEVHYGKLSTSCFYYNTNALRVYNNSAFNYKIEEKSWFTTDFN